VTGRRVVEVTLGAEPAVEVEHAAEPAVVDVTLSRPVAVAGAAAPRPGFRGAAPRSGAGA
jgi:hypothetical protein